MLACERSTHHRRAASGGTGCCEEISTSGTAALVITSSWCIGSHQVVKVKANLTQVYIGKEGNLSIQYIKDACLYVCLFVCLFGFGAQTTGWIPIKFAMRKILI